MRRPIIFAVHEVKIFLQDKGDLAFSLLLPIALFAIMYGAFGSGLEFHGTAHIVNEDPDGVYSRTLIERLDAMPNLKVEPLSRKKAESRLDRSDLLMVIYIPEGFSANLASGQPAELTFRQRGNGGREDQITAAVVRGAVEAMAQEFEVTRQVEGVLAGSGIERTRISQSVQEHLQQAQQNPAVVVEKTTTGGSADPVDRFLPGIVTMFILFAVSLSARTLVEERKRGTLERLLTTRLTVGELFLGKFLHNVLRGFIQSFILLALAYAVFQMFNPVSFVECLFIASVFAAVVSSFGLIIGSIARTEDQASWIAVFFTQVMVMLGGTFFEISEGSALYPLSRISVNTYVNDALKTVIADDGGLGDVGIEMTILAGVAVVGLIVGRHLFRAVSVGK
ncbi:MAG: ABC transporter permease [Chloroflexi bacterium]|nr:ABC transporter permease [Chloroflexota bacterium]